MLTHPTLDQLNTLGLYGMAKAFSELDKHDDSATLSHAEWLGLLLDREMTHWPAAGLVDTKIRCLSDWRT